MKQPCYANKDEDITASPLEFKKGLRGVCHEPNSPMPLSVKEVKLKVRFFLSLFLIALCYCNIFAEPTKIIDTPTTGMFDYGSYSLNFRLFSEGSVLSRLDFGVFKMVNLGFGWETAKIIGTQDPGVSPPGLFLKVRPFLGDMILPSISFGYDGQGYFYDRDKNEFAQREKGIFVVIGRELFIPGFEVNIGGNIADFRSNTVCGFANAALNVEDKFFVLAEYDNIRIMPLNRLNLGLRFSITNELNIDLAGRDIGAEGRAAERIVQVNYLGRF